MCCSGRQAEQWESRSLSGGLRVLRALATTLARWDLGLQAAFPRLDEIAIDLPVLAFTVAASAATGVLCGLAPALRHSGSDPIEALKEGGLPVAGGRPSRANRLRGVLVVAEVAMATVLLVAGVLLIHSFLKLSRVDPGYDPTNVVTFQAALPEGYSFRSAQDLCRRGCRAARIAPRRPGCVVRAPGPDGDRPADGQVQKNARVS